MRGMTEGCMLCRDVHMKECFKPALVT